MKTFVYTGELWLPHPPEALFDFFADAFNLDEMMPPWLKFEVLASRPLELRAGLQLDYKLRIHRVPVRWRSEIAVWDPPHRFVDRQIKGPYRHWVHEHRFVSRDGGTLAIDHVEYAVPGGALVNKLFVRRDLEKIFAYRMNKLRLRFGGSGP